jgi:hypothetical protein
MDFEAALIGVPAEHERWAKTALHGSSHGSQGEKHAPGKRRGAYA